MDMHQSIITENSEETSRFGEEIGATLIAQRKRGTIPRIYPLCLYGDLGSGKTTFVQGFAKACGITHRLLSPTFIIVRRYETKHLSGYLYHLDLYRLQAEQQLYDLGLSEMLQDSQSCVIIEWAEKLGASLPPERFEVRCALLNDDRHQIDIHAYI
jgi:tRNA threonylcarbamoyladenosine biosynthesis protein TsaE